MKSPAMKIEGSDEKDVQFIAKGKKAMATLATADLRVLLCLLISVICIDSDCITFIRIQCITFVYYFFFTY